MNDETSEAAALEAQVRAFPHWYHRIELPHGVVTPGGHPHSAAAYRVPDRLDGKRVLDVGAWDGFWTFEALKRGAAEAVAIDDFSDFLADCGIVNTSGIVILPGPKINHGVIFNPLVARFF